MWRTYEDSLPADGVETTIAGHRAAEYNIMKPTDWNNQWWVSCMITFKTSYGVVQQSLYYASQKYSPTAQAVSWRTVGSQIFSRPPTSSEIGRLAARRDACQHLGPPQGGTVLGGWRRAGSDPSSRIVVAVTSATACSNASRLASEVFWIPLILRTYCRAAASIS